MQPVLLWARSAIPATTQTTSVHAPVFHMFPAWLKHLKAWLTNLLVTLFRDLYVTLLSTQSRGARERSERWRDIPGGSIEPLLADLNGPTRAAYRRALNLFNDWCLSRGHSLITAEDVDVCACCYFACCNRSQCGTLVSALARVYTHLRRELVWSSARLKSIAGVQPPVHHQPLPWLVTIAALASYSWAGATVYDQAN
jgi:hypothetical protein